MTLLSARVVRVVQNRLTALQHDSAFTTPPVEGSVHPELGRSERVVQVAAVAGQTPVVPRWLALGSLVVLVVQIQRVVAVVVLVRLAIMVPAVQVARVVQVAFQR